jgi:hypothetical protein
VMTDPVLAMDGKTYGALLSLAANPPKQPDA